MLVWPTHSQVEAMFRCIESYTPHWPLTGEGKNDDKGNLCIRLVETQSSRRLTNSINHEQFDHLGCHCLDVAGYYFFLGHVYCVLQTHYCLSYLLLSAGNLCWLLMLIHLLWLFMGSYVGCYGCLCDVMLVVMAVYVMLYWFVKTSCDKTGDTKQWQELFELMH